MKKEFSTTSIKTKTHINFDDNTPQHSTVLDPVTPSPGNILLLQGSTPLHHEMNNEVDTIKKKRKSQLKNNIVIHTNDIFFSTQTPYPTSLPSPSSSVSQKKDNDKKNTTVKTKTKKAQSLSTDIVSVPTQIQSKRQTRSSSNITLPFSTVT